MAFSMFLRNTACQSRVMSQQMSRLVTPGMLAPRMLATQSAISTLPFRNLVLNEAKTAPLMNAIRSFRTSAVRLSSGASHDHSRLWVIERYVAVALMVLVPVGLMAPNKIVDMLLAVGITAHAHWGLEAIAVDYVRASIVGPILPKVAIGFVYLLSIVTLGGLFYVISHDVGICQGIRQLWAVKSEQKS